MENNQKEQKNSGVNQNEKQAVQNPSEGTLKNFSADQKGEGIKNGSSQKNDPLQGESGSTRQ